MIKAKVLKNAIKTLSTKEKAELFKNTIKKLNTEDKVKLFNVYARDERCLQRMGDFDELMKGVTPTELISKVNNGAFRLDDEYFHFDAYANLESFTEDEAVRYVVDWYGDEIAKTIAEALEDGAADVTEAVKVIGCLP